MAKLAIRLKSKPDLPDTLAVVRVHSASLFRVSSHQTGEPYFGKHQGNRFDDPHPDPAARYGTSYFAQSFDVAVAETLLHDRTPNQGYFYVERAVILNRFLVEFQGTELVLADVTGAELRRMGGHAALTGTSTLKIPQRWSSTIYHHADKVDGFRYMSRHLNNEAAYVVFDRAAHKLSMTRATRLADHPDFGRVAARLYITSTRPRPRRL
jgi:hypothetical protein